MKGRFPFFLNIGQRKEDVPLCERERGCRRARNRPVRLHRAGHVGGDDRRRGAADIQGPRRIGETFPWRQEFPRQQQCPRVFRRGPVGKDLHRVRGPDIAQQDLRRTQERSTEER